MPRVQNKGETQTPGLKPYLHTATASASPVRLNLLSHEAHQPLLANNAVRTINRGRSSPTATLNSLTGALVED